MELVAPLLFLLVDVCVMWLQVFFLHLTAISSHLLWLHLFSCGLCNLASAVFFKSKLFDFYTPQ